jgi:hypothetical protein
LTRLLIAIFRREWGGKVAAAKFNCGISSWWIIMN